MMPGRHRTTIMREVTANGDRANYRAGAAEQTANPHRRRTHPRSVAGRDRVGPLRRTDPAAAVRGVDLCRRLRRHLGRRPTLMPADAAPAPPVAYRPQPQQAPGIAEHRRPSRCRQRACRARPLGSRPDHRQEEPQLHDHPHRTGHPLLDPGHDAVRLHRARRPRWAGRRVRTDPRPSAALGTFDQGSEWAEWERLIASYGTRLLVLRTALAVATRPDREPQPPVQVLVPARNRPRRRRPADADHAASIINRQRRRGLNNHSPHHLYTALTVH